MITIHLLPNISRGKDNQGMKFDQQIEHNMKSTFLKKYYAGRGVETSPRPISKKIKIKHISRSIYLNFIQFVLTACPNLGPPKYIKTKVLATEGLELGFLPHFQHDFSRKIFFTLYSVNDQISLSECLYFFRYWAIRVL